MRHKIKTFIMALGRFYSLFENVFLITLLLAMIILSCSQIALRLIWSSGATWIEPLLRHIVVWSGLLGASVATKSRRHISIDALKNFLPVRLSCWLTPALDLFAAIVSAFLVHAAMTFMHNEIAFSGTATLIGLPKWTFSLIYPFAFTVITCRFLANAIAGVSRNITYPQDADRCQNSDPEFTF